MLPPGSLASRVILSYHTQEANQALLAATWREALPQKVPQKRISEKKTLKEAKPKLSQKPQALAKIGTNFMGKDPMPELARIYREERDGFLEATLTAWSSKVFPTSKSNNKISNERSFLYITIIMNVYVQVGSYFLYPRCRIAMFRFADCLWTIAAHLPNRHGWCTKSEKSRH